MGVSTGTCSIHAVAGGALRARRREAAEGVEVSPSCRLLRAARSRVETLLFLGALILRSLFPRRQRARLRRSAWERGRFRRFRLGPATRTGRGDEQKGYRGGPAEHARSLVQGETPGYAGEASDVLHLRGYFRARGYFASMVGRNEAVIREYIRNQEKEDKRLGQPSLIK